MDVGIFRATNVLKHYRGFELPEGEKFSAWVNKLINHPSFKATCSTEELYIDSYERYAHDSLEYDEWTDYYHWTTDTHLIGPARVRLRTLLIREGDFLEFTASKIKSICRMHGSIVILTNTKPMYKRKGGWPRLLRRISRHPTKINLSMHRWNDLTKY